MVHKWQILPHCNWNKRVVVKSLKSNFLSLWVFAFEKPRRHLQRWTEKMTLFARDYANVFINISQ